MATTNIINAVFGSGLCAVTTSAFRANYGMVLRFSGIDLPTAFECDFSNYDVMGHDSITAIGQNGEVQIPDDLWDSGLNIYAYVYLHPTDDSGVTVYTVTIPVLGRPNRTEEQPTPHEQSVIEQAISALNDAVEQTAADVVAADASASAAAQSEANAATSERASAASAGAALASQNAAESASQSATESATNASESARNAANSAAQAAESATAAQESAEQAERSAQSISGDVERAESAEATATVKATEAGQSATAAAQSASSASVSAQNAASSAQSAESSATDAEQAKQDAQDAKEAAETAQAAAEQAKDDAVTAADRAEQAEQEVLSAMDGTYENLTSGNAQQLLSTVTEANSVPYLFRPTAANADRAYLDEVVGGTVAWNQLYNPSIVAPTTTTNGVTFTKNEDGSISVSGTATADVTLQLVGALTVVTNHKMLIKGSPSGGTYNTYSITTTGYSDYGKGIIVNNTSNVRYVWIRIGNGTTITTPIVFKPQIFDLTQKFGSTIADYIYSLEQANAGAGVAWFRKLFPKPYYAYNAGELLSVSGLQSHDMVGFNQWDEEWVSGYYLRENGDITPATNAFVSKNYIHCFPNTAYYFKNTHNVCFYDENKHCIQRVFMGTGVYSTLSNAHYLKFDNRASLTYKNDICINLSDPVRNGTYEPYTKRTYPLDSSLTLRGIPKLDASNNLYYDGDTYAPDGTVTRRYGIVDLGTLNWINAGANKMFYTRALNGDVDGAIAIRRAISSDELFSWGSDSRALTKRSYNGIGTSTPYSICVSIAGNIIATLDTDTAYTNAAAFKAAMNGVMLVYELATPTTETATPYRHLQICDPNGTEEFVSTSIVPVGHNTRYPENLRAKIEGLPWNFNSIIAMTETTTTASKAYSVGDYFILNNVLYRVTSAIASGGTITIGTNCRATTIMDEIKALY